MKRILKDLFFAITPKRLSRDRAVILMYHSVGPKNGYFFNVTAENFNTQMELLKKSGRPVIALKELVRRLRAKASLGGAVAITFDDGYRDNHTNAFLTLKKYGFPATIFVTTDLVGKKDARGFERVNESDMREMELSGLIDIEPHTKTHPHLAELNESDARKEIESSKQAIEALLGKKSRLFAYPYGNYSDETVLLVQEVGFESAVTVQEGTVGMTSDPFRLPRNSVDSSTTSVQFAGKLSEAVDFYERYKKFFV